jgi:signal transduction histidine kinase
MNKTLGIFILIAGLGTETVSAAEFGTAAEARSMIEAAALAVATNKEEAIEDFTAGEAPFKEKDLYVFCAEGNSEKSTITAHGANSMLIGKENQDWLDKAGKPFVQEMWQLATEGELGIVEYLWPRPGEQYPAQKASYVTRIGDILCGVGYYK